MLFKRWVSLYQPEISDLPTRRHDLDWLRVLAFALLIFYHIGMLYVENWGFHIKSQYLSSYLESVMLLVNPWRMPILWMISGIAIRFVLARVSLAHFIQWRSYRLLLPLLFGILVVVPPQLYYEMSFKDGLSINYFEFYKAFWQLENPLFDNYKAGIWPHIDVNHLWYLRELWQFSIAMLLFIPVLNSKAMTLLVDWMANRNGIFILSILTLPIIAVQFYCDESREPLGFLFLCYGYILGWHSRFWERLREHCHHLLFVSAVCSVFVVVFYNAYWLNQSDATNPAVLILGEAVYSFDRLIWVTAILGLGYRYLNNPSGSLSYYNDAVYPFYILHQSIIIAVGYELSVFQFGPVLEPLLVLTLTVLGCFLMFEMIRRTDILRPFFGLKLKGIYSTSVVRIMRFCSWILVSILGLEILI